MPLHKVHGNLDLIQAILDGHDRFGNRFVTPANLSSLSVMPVLGKETVIRLVTDEMESDARKPAFYEIYRLGHFKVKETHYFPVLCDGEISPTVLQRVVGPIADRIFDGAFGDIMMTSLLEFVEERDRVTEITPRETVWSIVEVLRRFARKRARDMGVPMPSPYKLKLGLLEPQSGGWKYWPAPDAIHDFHVAPTGRTAIMVDNLADYVDEELFLRSVICAPRPNPELDRAMVRGISVSDRAFFSRYHDHSAAETLCIKDGRRTRVFDGWFEHRLITEFSSPGVPFTKAGTKSPAEMLITRSGRRKVTKTDTKADEDNIHDKATIES